MMNIARDFSSDQDHHVHIGNRAYWCALWETLYKCTATMQYKKTLNP